MKSLPSLLAVTVVISQLGLGGGLSAQDTAVLEVLVPSLRTPVAGETDRSPHGFYRGTLPVTTLIRGGDGNFYGTTSLGGAANGGTVFRMTPAGALTTLVSFENSSVQAAPEGSHPRAALVQLPDGYFYGTSFTGGANDQGTIFRLSSAGEFAKLADTRSYQPNFGGAISPLVLAADGSLYGSTEDIAFHLVGNNLAELALFQGAVFVRTPIPPKPVLIAGLDGNFYGTTAIENHYSFFGRVFRMTGTGQVSSVANLPGNSTDFEAVGPLTLGHDGSLYGCKNGMAFKVDPQGTVTPLVSFTGPNGLRPRAALIEGPDGNFYGSTYEGGDHDPDPANPRPGGTIFRLTPAGNLTTLVSFSDATGTAPNSALAIGNDGCFYGTTSKGGSTDGGTVFRLTVFPPQIIGVFPGTNPEGDPQFAIVGRFFSGTTDIAVDGIPASSFAIDAPTKVTAILPPDANLNGTLFLATPLGSVAFDPSPTSPGPLLNISTRGMVGLGDDAMIGGFILQGNAPKEVMIRAIGPSLGAAGVPGALANPTLELHNASGAIIDSNDDWPDSPNRQAIIESGIAPSHDQESAILMTLDPGSYTAVIRGAGETTGLALVEAYDLGAVSGKLANISTRGRVQTSDNVMIGGFIIGGASPGKVLVRAIGPSLGQTTPPVPGALADPELELHDGQGNLIAANDNWQEGPQRQHILDTTIAPSHPAESAILASLAPGNYTAIVRGANTSTGVGLVEIYKLD